jgi:hypothetical protein
VFKIDTKEDALVLVVDDIQNSQFQLPSTSITERCKTIRSIYLAVKRWDVERYSLWNAKSIGNNEVQATA